MSRRWVVLVAALLLLAAALWRVFADGVDPTFGTALPSAPAAQPSSAVAAPVADLHDGVAARTEVVAEAPPSIPDDATWIDVLVVDKASGAPVAGADVAWDDGTTWNSGVAALSMAGSRCRSTIGRTPCSSGSRARIA